MFFSLKTQRFPGGKGKTQHFPGGKGKSQHFLTRSYDNLPHCYYSLILKESHVVEQLGAEIGRGKTWGLFPGLPGPVLRTWMHPSLPQIFPPSSWHILISSRFSMTLLIKPKTVGTLWPVLMNF